MKYILCFILIGFAKITCCQIVEYSFSKQSSLIGVIKTYHYYWKIDSNKTITFKNEVYCQFTFSQDSTSVSGYLRINKKKYFFLTEVEGIDTFQVQMFNLNRKGNYKIDYFGNLGTLTTFKVKKKKNEKIVVEIKPRENYHINHQPDILSLIFIDDYPYPYQILFIEDNEYLVMSNLISK